MAPQCDLKSLISLYPVNIILHNDSLILLTTIVVVRSVGEVGSPRR